MSKKHYNTIDCPTCGNPISVRTDIKRPQKCEYCRRPLILHKVRIGKRVKGIEGEAIDFNIYERLQN